MDRTASTAAANATVTAAIADVQSSADSRRIAIDKVGIKDIRHPVRVRDRSDGEQHTIANFNMYVHLPHNFKGTHMSRFVAILNGHEHEIGVGTFKEMLVEMAERLESEAGHSTSFSLCPLSEFCWKIEKPNILFLPRCSMNCRAMSR